MTVVLQNQKKIRFKFEIRKILVQKHQQGAVFFFSVTSKVTRDISNPKIVTGYFSFHGLLFRKLSRVSQNCHGRLFRKLSRVTKKMSRVTIAKFSSREVLVVEAVFVQIKDCFVSKKDSMIFLR